MPILNSSFLEKGTSGLNVADTGELLYPEARRLYYINIFGNSMHQLKRGGRMNLRVCNISFIVPKYNCVNVETRVQ
jgi:hypothetical protein